MKHDPAVEAENFDRLIRSSMDQYTDAALDMREDLKRYLAPGRPRPFSPWRATFWRLGDVAGKRVLDMGCGTGASSVILAAKGAQVTAMDISPESIAVARRRAAINGFEDVEFKVGSAYEMPFEAESFDMVLLCAVLHHLDLARTRDEVRRVLRPGGEAHFLEPVALSATVTAIRDMIPVARNCETPDERELTDADLDLFCEGFTSKELVFMGLVGSRIDRFIPQKLAKLMELVYDTDAMIMDLEIARKLADMVVGRVVR